MACSAVALVLAACGSDDDSAGDTIAPVESVDDGSGDGSGDAGGDVVQETGPIEFEPGTQLEPFVDPVDDPMIGATAPIVAGERFDGSAITIGGETAGPTLYVFLAHWCPHCNDEIPKLIELDEDGRLPADLDIVGISTAADETRDNYPPSTWLTEKGWPWDAMVDDENLSAIRVWGGSGFPYAVVVDDDGTVLSRRAGTASTDEIADWLNATVA